MFSLVLQFLIHYLSEVLKGIAVFICFDQENVAKREVDAAECRTLFLSEYVLCFCQFFIFDRRVSTIDVVHLG